MYHYAQLGKDGVCFADSYLSGEVGRPDMILLPGTGSRLGWQYVDGQWLSPEAEGSHAASGGDGQGLPGQAEGSQGPLPTT